MNGAWPEIPRVLGVFVTGTDTDVGKTAVAAGLTAALRSQNLRATYFKPVQSGCREENGQLIASDARLAQTMAGLDEPQAVLTPVVLKLPLAPAVAAAQAGVRIDLEDIAKAYRYLAGRYDFLVVEGAGGLYVPLVDNNFLVLDLARWLGLPVLVVARPGLGTINHTVMTVKTAQQAGLPVVGIIINQYPDEPNLAARTNPEIIAAVSGRPILAKVPVIADLESDQGKATLIRSLTEIFQTPAWQQYCS
jgi:dethiobiotin synthetase